MEEVKSRGTLVDFIKRNDWAGHLGCLWLTTLSGQAQDGCVWIGHLGQAGSGWVCLRLVTLGGWSQGGCVCVGHFGWAGSG